jgi:hypothetical protein
MRGVGKDATQLFMEMHSWVNIGRILERYFIGNCELRGYTNLNSTIIGIIGGSFSWGRTEMMEVSYYRIFFFFFIHLTIDNNVHSSTLEKVSEL